MRRLILGVSVALLVGGYAWVLAQVRSMEDAEADEWGHPQRLSDLEVIAHRQLITVGVRPGQSVLLEVCSEDGFVSPAWDAVAFEVWFLPMDERVVSKPLRALRSSIRRDIRGLGCVVVTRREGLGVEGELGLGVAFEVLPEALAPVELQGHGVVWAPIDPAAKAALGVLLLAALGLLVGWSWRPARDVFAEALQAEIGVPGRAAGVASLAWRPLALGLGAVALTLGALAFVRGGAATALLRALTIAGVELATAWVLARRPEVAGGRRPGEALGFGRPRGGWKVLAAAPILGVAVWLLGSLLIHWVPSTSLSPIEAFVAAPSGALALGSVALFVPVAEEVFFRGFVYGVVGRARGPSFATVATIALFALAHLPQQWGAWGPSLSVAFTGAVLTLLRRWSGGVLLPALVHLAHNAWITFLSV